MKFFKNRKHRLLVTLNDNGCRFVLNNGVSFAAPKWYQPAYEPLEEISEDEYRYIAESNDWEQNAPTRNDSYMYNDWD